MADDKPLESTEAVAEMIVESEDLEDLECVQVDDGEGNIVRFTPEQLIEEGIDIANITEADVEKLVQMAKNLTAMLGSANIIIEEDVENPESGAVIVTESVETVHGTPVETVIAPSDADTNMESTALQPYLKSLLAKATAKKPTPKEQKPFLPTAPFSATPKVALKPDSSQKPRRGRPRKNPLTPPAAAAAHPAAEVRLSDLDEEMLANLVESGVVKFVDEDGNPLSPSNIFDLREAAVAEEANNLETPVSDQEKPPPASKRSETPKSSAAARRYVSKVNQNLDSTTQSRLAAAYSLVGNTVELKRGHRLIPAKVKQVRHGIHYKVEFEDGHVEWVGENETVVPDREVMLSSIHPESEDSDNEDDELSDEPESEKRCFGKVSSQFDLTHRKKKYFVSVGEVERRLHSPEHMRITHVDQLLRGSQRGGEMKRKLAEYDIEVPPYEKKRAKHTAFSRWLEGESDEVVTSLKSECLPYFPCDDLQNILADKLSDWDEEEKKTYITRTKEMMSIIRRSINSEKNYDNPIWKEYSILTHEFGPLALKHFLKLMSSVVDIV